LLFHCTYHSFLISWFWGFAPEELVDGAVQRVRDQWELVGLRKAPGVFPGFHGGAGDADAATELGFAQFLFFAENLDGFRVCTSLTFCICRVTLIPLTVDARKRRSPLTWFYDKTAIAILSTLKNVFSIFVCFAITLYT